MFLDWSRFELRDEPILTNRYWIGTGGDQLLSWVMLLFNLCVLEWYCGRLAVASLARRNF